MAEFSPEAQSPPVVTDGAACQVVPTLASAIRQTAECTVLFRHSDIVGRQGYIDRWNQEKTRAYLARKRLCDAS